MSKPTIWNSRQRYVPKLVYLVKGDYDEDLKDAVVTWLNNQAATWYEEGIHKLVPRYKCLNVKGDYDEDLKDAVVTWLNNQAATCYEEGIHKLVPRYKCLDVKGDYVER